MQTLLCVTFAMTKCLDISLSFCFVFVYHHPSNPSIHCIASQSFKQSTTCAHAPKISHGGSRAYRPVNSAGMNKTARSVNLKTIPAALSLINLPKMLFVSMCQSSSNVSFLYFQNFLISASRRKLLLCLSAQSSVPARAISSQTRAPSALGSAQFSIIGPSSCNPQSSTNVFPCLISFTELHTLFNSN